MGGGGGDGDRRWRRAAAAFFVGNVFFGRRGEVERRGFWYVMRWGEGVGEYDVPRGGRTRRADLRNACCCSRHSFSSSASS